MALQFNGKRTFKFDEKNEDGSLNFSITFKFGTFEDYATSGEEISKAILKCIRESIVGWENIVDENGEPQVVNEDNQRAVLNILVQEYPELFSRIQEAFTEVNSKKK